jgi:hypothetical protein
MVCTVAAGTSADYYIEEQAAYYLKGKEPPGRWYTPRNSFGFVDRTLVQAEAFRALHGGKSPEGVQLARAAHRRNPETGEVEQVRTDGFDIQFGAPKPLSLLWAKAAAVDPTLARRIESIYEDSIREALDLMQNHAAFTRTGHFGEGGDDATTGRIEQSHLFGATFMHFSARPQERGSKAAPAKLDGSTAGIIEGADTGDGLEQARNIAADMHLHAHAVIMNLAERDVDDTGAPQWGALDARYLYAWKMACGAAHHATLANRLRDELGLDVNVYGRNGEFTIGGIDKDICDEFSSRRGTLLEQAAKHGVDAARDPRLMAAITLAERLGKGEDGDATHEDRVNRWHIETDLAGFTEEAFRSCFTRAPTRHPDALTDAEFEDALKALPDALTQTESVIRPQDLYRETLVLCARAGRPIDDIDVLVSRVLALPDMIPVPKARDSIGQPLYTTTAIMEAETGVFELTVKHRADTNHVLSQLTVEAALDSPTYDDKGAPAFLTDEQKEGVRLLTTRAGLHQIVEGAAGTGKSFLLTTVAALYREAGYRVIVTAAAHQTAKTLAREIGLSDTDGRAAAEWIAMWKNGVDPLTTKTLVITEEAGQMGVIDTHAVMRAADAVGAKLVYTGDRSQQRSVSAGPALDIIAAAAPGLRLVDSQRMRIQADDILVHIEGLSRADAIAKAATLTGADRAALFQRHAKTVADAIRSLQHAANTTGRAPVTAADVITHAGGLVRAAAAYRAAGFRVVATAATLETAQALSSAASAPAATDADATSHPPKPPSKTWIPARALADWLRDFKRREPDDKTIVLIDRANINAAEWRALQTVATRTGARILATDDLLARLNPADRAAAEALLPHLEAHERRSLVNDHGDVTARSFEAWMRKAAEDASRGTEEHARAALDAFTAHGRFHWADTTDDAVRAAVEDWKAYVADNPFDDAMIIAKSNAAVREANALIRAHLKEQPAAAGGIGLEDTHIATITRSKARVSLPLAIGDRIRFCRKDRALSVFNGSVGTIRAIAPHPTAPNHAILTVAVMVKEAGRDAERLLTVDTLTYGQRNPSKPTGHAFIEHAYASTLFSSQGATRRAVFEILDSLHSANAFYVGASRARDFTKLYASRFQESVYLRDQTDLRLRKTLDTSDAALLAQMAKGLANPQRKVAVRDFLHPGWRDTIKTLHAAGYAPHGAAIWTSYATNATSPQPTLLEDSDGHFLDSDMTAPGNAAPSAAVATSSATRRPIRTVITPIQPTPLESLPTADDLRRRILRFSHRAPLTQAHDANRSSEVIFSLTTPAPIGLSSPPGTMPASIGVVSLSEPLPWAIGASTRRPETKGALRSMPRDDTSPAPQGAPPRNAQAWKARPKGREFDDAQIQRETELIKREVDLGVLLSRNGWSPVAGRHNPNTWVHWTRSGKVEEGARTLSICLTKDGWRYKVATGGEAGTAFQLASRGHIRLGDRHVSDFLNTWLNLRESLQGAEPLIVPGAPISAADGARRQRDRAEQDRRWQEAKGKAEAEEAQRIEAKRTENADRFSRFDPAARTPAGNYLEGRGIPRALQVAEGFAASIRFNRYGSACFAHRGLDGRITGFEVKNDGWTKNFSEGTGGRHLAVFGNEATPTRFLICETAVDLLSRAQQEGPRTDTLYLSSGGTPSAAGIAMLRALADRHPDASIDIGTDRDHGGLSQALDWRNALADLGDRVSRLLPALTKDWNADLRLEIGSLSVEKYRADLPSAAPPLPSPPLSRPEALAAWIGWRDIARLPDTVTDYPAIHGDTTAPTLIVVTERADDAQALVAANTAAWAEHNARTQRQRPDTEPSAPPPVLLAMAVGPGLMAPSDAPNMDALRDAIVGIAARHPSAALRLNAPPTEHGIALSEAVKNVIPDHDVEHKPPTRPRQFGDTSAPSRIVVASNDATAAILAARDGHPAGVLYLATASSRLPDHVTAIARNIARHADTPVILAVDRTPAGVAEATYWQSILTSGATAHKAAVTIEHPTAPSSSGPIPMATWIAAYRITEGDANNPDQLQTETYTADLAKAATPVPPPSDASPYAAAWMATATARSWTAASDSPAATSQTQIPDISAPPSLLAAVRTARIACEADSAEHGAVSLTIDRAEIAAQRAARDGGHSDAEIGAAALGIAPADYDTTNGLPTLNSRPGLRLLPAQVTPLIAVQLARAARLRADAERGALIKATQTEIQAQTSARAHGISDDRITQAAQSVTPASLQDQLPGLAIIPNPTHAAAQTSAAAHSGATNPPLSPTSQPLVIPGAEGANPATPSPASLIHDGATAPSEAVPDRDPVIESVKAATRAAEEAAELSSADADQTAPSEITPPDIEDIMDGRTHPQTATGATETAAPPFTASSDAALDSDLRRLRAADARIDAPGAAYNQPGATVGEDFGNSSNPDDQRQDWTRKLGEWYETHFAPKHEAEIADVYFRPGSNETIIHFKDKSRLRDTGDAILLTGDSTATPSKAALIVEIALARGLTSVSVRGSADFRRELARQCWLAGVTVNNLDRAMRVDIAAMRARGLSPAPLEELAAKRDPAAPAHPQATPAPLPPTPQAPDPAATRPVDTQTVVPTQTAPMPIDPLANRLRAQTKARLESAAETLVAANAAGSADTLQAALSNAADARTANDIATKIAAARSGQTTDLDPTLFSDDAVAMWIEDEEARVNAAAVSTSPTSNDSTPPAPTEAEIIAAVRAAIGRETAILEPVAASGAPHEASGAKDRLATLAAITDADILDAAVRVPFALNADTARLILWEAEEQFAPEPVTTGADEMADSTSDLSTPSAPTEAEIIATVRAAIGRETAILEPVAASGAPREASGAKDRLATLAAITDAAILDSAARVPFALNADTARLILWEAEKQFAPESVITGPDEMADTTSDLSTPSALTEAAALQPSDPLAARLLALTAANLLTAQQAVANAIDTGTASDIDSAQVAADEALDRHELAESIAAARNDIQPPLVPTAESNEIVTDLIAMEEAFAERASIATAPLVAAGRDHPDVIPPPPEAEAEAVDNASPTPTAPQAAQPPGVTDPTALRLATALQIAANATNEADRLATLAEAAALHAALSPDIAAATTAQTALRDAQRQAETATNRVNTASTALTAHIQAVFEDPAAARQALTALVTNRGDTLAADMIETNPSSLGAFRAPHTQKAPPPAAPLLANDLRTHIEASRAAEAATARVDAIAVTIASSDMTRGREAIAALEHLTETATLSPSVLLAPTTRSTVLTSLTPDTIAASTVPDDAKTNLQDHVARATAIKTLTALPPAARFQAATALVAASTQVLERLDASPEPLNRLLAEATAQHQDTAHAIATEAATAIAADPQLQQEAQALGGPDLAAAALAEAQRAALEAEQQHDLDDEIEMD